MLLVTSNTCALVRLLLRVIVTVPFPATIVPETLLQPVLTVIGSALTAEAESAKTAQTVIEIRSLRILRIKGMFTSNPFTNVWLRPSDRRSLSRVQLKKYLSERPPLGSPDDGLLPVTSKRAIL